MPNHGQMLIEIFLFHLRNSYYPSRLTSSMILVMTKLCQLKIV